MGYKELADHTVNGLGQFGNVPIGYHLMFGFCIRLCLIIYGNYYDSSSHLKYTDIDYKVFTDAARLVLDGESPFDRVTYRYSPVIAWLMVPNVVFNENFGKVLFSVVDIMISITIKLFVHRQLKEREGAEKIAKYCSMFWLYNPLSIGISTRGSADSISCFIILLSIYFLQYEKTYKDCNFLIAGMFLGIAIHLRLYPIIFSLPMYMSIGEYKITRNTTIREGFNSLIPNKKQVLLASSTVVYLGLITYSMYLMYGYKFIFETYVYHLFRIDIKHNFSMFFYTSYLTMTDDYFDFMRFTALSFVGLIFLMLNVVFSINPRNLPFALFCHAAVFVTYNSVVTSQYFIWYLSLLPLVVHDIAVKPLFGLFLIWFWMNSQFLWLVFAYFVEFHNQELFLWLGIMGVYFYATNIAVLMQLIASYSPGHAFGFPNTSVRGKIK